MSANPLLVSSPCRCVRKLIKGTLDRYYILLIVLNYVLKATKKSTHTRATHTHVLEYNQLIQLSVHYQSGAQNSNVVVRRRRSKPETQQY